MEVAAACTIAAGGLKAFAECGGQKPGSWTKPAPNEYSSYLDVASSRAQSRATQTL